MSAVLLQEAQKVIWGANCIFKKEPSVRKAVDKPLASRILRIVHNHEGFRFYVALGDYTGINAMSLKDFAKKLRVVDIQSINFHFSRGDFWRWIQFIIGDVALSSRINRIPQDTRGEKLRSDLIKAVNKRIGELKKI